MSYKAFDPTGYKKKKKKKRIIILSVVLVVLATLIAVVCVVCVKQKNNIQALSYASKYTTEEIESQIAENDAKTQEEVSKIAGKELRPLTDEESALLQSGEITEEEALALIQGDATLEEIQSGEYTASADSAENSSESGGTDSSGDTESGTSSSGASAGTESELSGSSGSSGSDGDGSSSSASSSGSDGNSDSTGSTDNSNVQTILSKIYLLKSEYTASIDSLISDAKADVASGAAEGNGQIELLQKYTARGNELESSCDSRMDSLISELTAELLRTGGDTSVADQVRSAYENEKSLKKAELVSKYGG